MQLEKLVLPLEVGSQAFSTGIGIAIAGVTALVGAMAVAVKATFTWADELDSIQDVIGGTNEEAAALNFTLRKSGTDTETFNKSLVIMSKGLVKADGTLDTVGNAMKKWGIDVKDSNGNLKTQQQLIAEVSKKYSTFSTQQEKVNFLTEVFGRGGAEMIDFFDTLAQEGGIDAVTQKVKDLGLVIDPARYEQFTRSLEEIKLAGLGMAISFTEKVMPVFEGLLTWVNSFRGLSLTDALDKLTLDFSTLGTNFSNWAKSIDWAQVSTDLIDGINGIDWATLGQNVGNGFKGVFDGLKTIVANVNWGGLFKAAGTAFLNFMAGLTGQGSWANVKATWTANMSQMKQIVSSALAIMKQAFLNTLNNIKNDVANIFSNIKASIIAAISGAVTGALGILQTLIDALGSLAIGTSVSSTTGSLPANVAHPGRASGGYASGMTMVGENGPELVNLPSGAYVNNAISSRAMTNQPVKAYIDYDELARTMGRVLGQQMQRA